MSPIYFTKGGEDCRDLKVLLACQTLSRLRKGPSPNGHRQVPPVSRQPGWNEAGLRCELVPVSPGAERRPCGQGQQKHRPHPGRRKAFWAPQALTNKNLQKSQVFKHIIVGGSYEPLRIIPTKTNIFICSSQVQGLTALGAPKPPADTPPVSEPQGSSGSSQPGRTQGCVSGDTPNVHDPPPPPPRFWDFVSLRDRPRGPG